MSGLELFLDGGTTLATIATAAFGALGYKQKEQDTRDLADPQELEELLAALQKAHAGVSASHGTRDAASAAARGVPDWAVACVRKGRGLVGKAAELEDLADVYEAQIGIAVGEGARGKGLLRAPPRLLVERLGDLAEGLVVHVPYMELARGAFDNPADAAPGVGSAEAMKPQEVVSSFQLAADQDDPKLLPIAILRNRGRLGELWHLQGEKLGKLFASRSGRELDADTLLPPDVRRSLGDLRSKDRYEAMAAAWVLGRLGSTPTSRDDRSDEALHVAVRRAATAALLQAVSGDGRCPDESVRKAALTGLAQIASPDAVPVLRSLEHDREETAACRELAARIAAGLEAGTHGPHSGDDSAPPSAVPGQASEASAE